MRGGQINFLDEIIVDNFAGGGGASTGMELATGRPVTIAINHDPDAILMHKTNHPHTEHLQASVWDVDPREVCRGAACGPGVVFAGLQALFKSERSGLSRPEYKRTCVDCAALGWNSPTEGDYPGECRGICNMGTGAQGKAGKEKGRADILEMEEPAAGPGVSG